MKPFRFGHAPQSETFGSLWNQPFGGDKGRCHSWPIPCCGSYSAAAIAAGAPSDFVTPGKDGNLRLTVNYEKFNYLCSKQSLPANAAACQPYISPIICPKQGIFHIRLDSRCPQITVDTDTVQQTTSFTPVPLLDICFQKDPDASHVVIHRGHRRGCVCRRSCVCTLNPIERVANTIYVLSICASTTSKFLLSRVGDQSCLILVTPSPLRPLVIITLTPWLIPSHKCSYQPTSSSCVLCWAGLRAIPNISRVWPCA